MGQLILLIGVIAMFAAGARGAVEPALTLFTPETPGQAWLVVGLTLAGMALACVLGHLACVLAGRRIDQAGEHATVRFAFMASGVSRWAGLVIFMVGLLAGGMLDGVRLLVGGDLVLLDEALTLGSLLGVLVWNWRAIAPIDRRLREAATLSLLDRGDPAPMVISDWAFVGEQVRHQLLIVLLPVGLITLWVEAADRVFGTGPGEGAHPLVHTAGALVVIVLMPLALRVIWRTVRLEEGELRERLMEVCRRHRVRVNDVLLWRTGSGMANGAVIGFVPWLRFVLLSDGLLERLPTREVEAVMAHEIGHIRRRHIVWMGAFLLSLLTVSWGGMAVLAERALIDEARTAAMVQADREAEARLERASSWFGSMAAFRDASEARRLANAAIERDNRRREAAAYAGLLGAVPIVALGFGFVSRRIERQADAFAAQHLSGLGLAETDAEADARIDAESAATMSAALARVAHANGMDQGRFTFRHGSIAERRRHLNGLIGEPIGRPTIDRTIGRIKILTLVLVGLAGLLIVFG